MWGFIVSEKNNGVSSKGQVGAYRKRKEICILESKLKF